MPKLLRQILVFGLLTLDITLLCGDIELFQVLGDVRGLVRLFPDYLGVAQFVRKRVRERQDAFVAEP